MEQMLRSAKYVFQGTMYFYRAYKIQCRYQFTLREEIDPELMQQALDAALAKAEYFRVRLVWEKRDAFLEPNPERCLLHRGSEMRQMPEQTQGYLFSVGCQGCQLFVDWYHFIADGSGISRFIALLLKEYLNRRSGTTFACAPLVCSPPYDIAAMMEQYPAQGSENLDSKAVQTCEGQPQYVRVRVDKEAVVRAALRGGAKPFSALTALLCEGFSDYLGKEMIRYSYSADTRKVAGVPDALYNCVASFQDNVRFGPGQGLAQVLPVLDAQVRAALEPDNQIRVMAEQMGWIYKVSQQKASLRIKQRVFQMGEYLSGAPADFWISYLGYPLGEWGRVLEPYLEDFQVWVPADGASMGVEASSLNGVFTLCIQNKTERPGLAQALRQAFEREGIPVLEAQELVPPVPVARPATA
ncbi:MAG: hypothetical protein ACI4JC_06705 [Faecalibacterium sp.]